MSDDLLQLMGVSLRLGDCIEQMRQMPDASVDSIVTDPPYELGFMGKGSTGKAAVLEGFQFVGIDMTAEYVEIARGRVLGAIGQP